MPLSRSSKGKTMPDADLTAQAVLAGLGSFPVQPVLPDDDRVDDALAALARVQTTAAYADLFARRQRDELDAKAFLKAVIALVAADKE